jgi:hypothetical protein
MIDHPNGSDEQSDIQSNGIGTPKPSHIKYHPDTPGFKLFTIQAIQIWNPDTPGFLIIHNPSGSDSVSGYAIKRYPEA